MTPGEHKSIQTDRVVFVLGPQEEVAKVRWIFRSFVTDGLSEAQIADNLNTVNVLTDRGRPWTKGTVHQILINEKYVGNNVWNRTSFKLKMMHVCNTPENWIRANGVFEPIVDKQLFDGAQAIIGERSYRMPDKEMIAALQGLFEQQDFLSGIIIDEAVGLPQSSNFFVVCDGVMRVGPVRKYSIGAARPRPATPGLGPKRSHHCAVFHRQDKRNRMNYRIITAPQRDFGTIWRRRDQVSVVRRDKDLPSGCDLRNRRFWLPARMPWAAPPIVAPANRTPIPIRIASNMCEPIALTSCLPAWRRE